LDSSANRPALSTTSLRRESYFAVSEMSAYTVAGLDFRFEPVLKMRDLSEPFFDDADERNDAAS
jgi:hypothetical protein